MSWRSEDKFWSSKSKRVSGLSDPYLKKGQREEGGEDRRKEGRGVRKGWEEDDG